MSVCYYEAVTTLIKPSKQVKLYDGQRNLSCGVLLELVSFFKCVCVSVFRGNVCRGPCQLATLKKQCDQIFISCTQATASRTRKMHDDRARYVSGSTSFHILYDALAHKHAILTIQERIRFQSGCFLLSSVSAGLSPVNIFTHT